MNNLLHSNILRNLLLIVSLATFLFLYTPYRRDIQNAYTHLNSLERQVIETDCGAMEVAIRGEGQPMLSIHGIAGGFDQGLGVTEGFLGKGYQVIAPSRFGYLGTPMPTEATPASQADAFVCLLDALGIRQATVIAHSAGGTSAIQLALRHPERVEQLILISTAAPTVGKYVTLPPRPIVEIVFHSDFLMWGITKFFQPMMYPAVGVPEGYPRSDAEHAIVSGAIRSVLPIKPRTTGFVFDMFTSNLDMDQHPDEYPMEKINVRTLIIHAVDDPLAKYENAKALAARIPNAKLISVPSGGHLFLSTDEMVRSELAHFLTHSVAR